MNNELGALVFDIETVGEDFDSIDETSQKVLTRWIDRTSETEEVQKEKLKEVKEQLGFSPLTGEIVAIGILDSKKEKGAAYYQAPHQKDESSEEGNIKYRVMSEPQMLTEFWRIAASYNEFVSFNGRGFDVPYMVIRSAIHGIKPTKDLMSNRYLSSQKYGANHIDLYDQFTFYGALRKVGGLHMFCRSFGIKSPKSEGVSGDDVARLYQDKRFLDIARYNSHDIIATKELYDKWREFVQF